jgi:hypothetical protein
MSRTIQDELLKDFSTAGSPASDDPNINNTTGAKVPRAVANWDEVPRLGSTENAGLTSSLPEQVTQSEIADENERLWGNIGPAKDGE